MENYNHRGFINARSNATYFIVNELVDDIYTKVFSAVKFETNNKKERYLEEGKYCVRYISKNLIKDLFFKYETEDKIFKFYENLRESYEEFSKIKHVNIQNLKDLLEDDEAIYIVSEFCDWTLKDYVQILREPNRNNPSFPFEKKYREIIVQILDTCYNMHEKFSQPLCGLINSTDIMVVEINDINSQNAVKVKLPHPFLTNLTTKIKILAKESFPNYYPPEVYNLFDKGEDGCAIESKKSLDSNILLQKLNQNFDMWALGSLVYEILFDDFPFKINDIDAGRNLTINTEFAVNPYSITYISLRFIDGCLKYNQLDRIQSNEFYDIIEEMRKDLDDMDKLGHELRTRMNHKSPQPQFNLKTSCHEVCKERS
jgi:serine/threonine protein kinase